MQRINKLFNMPDRYMKELQAVEANIGIARKRLKGLNSEIDSIVEVAFANERKAIADEKREAVESMKELIKEQAKAVKDQANLAKEKEEKRAEKKEQELFEAKAELNFELKRLASLKERIIENEKNAAARNAELEKELAEKINATLVTTAHNKALAVELEEKIKSVTVKAKEIKAREEAVKIKEDLVERERIGLSIEAAKLEKERVDADAVLEREQLVSAKEAELAEKLAEVERQLVALNDKQKEMVELENKYLDVIRAQRRK